VIKILSRLALETSDHLLFLCSNSFLNIEIIILEEMPEEETFKYIGYNMVRKNHIGLECFRNESIILFLPSSYMKDQSVKDAIRLD